MQLALFKLLLRDENGVDKNAHSTHFEYIPGVFRVFNE
jgi:hypothetical protein